MTRKLTDEEKTLWQSFTKTIKRLATNVVSETSDKIDILDKKEAKQISSKTVFQPTVDIITNNRTKESEIISKKLRNIRKISLDGRIDLHGNTREEAHYRLHNFLELAQLQNKTWVLVITGKGSIKQEGILKQTVPKWLNSWPFVASYTQAKAKDGGQGALYVRLKKLRRT